MYKITIVLISLTIIISGCASSRSMVGLDPGRNTRYEVLALSNIGTTELEGDMVFFLGTLKENYELYFYAYLKSPKQDIKLYRFPASATTIYEDVRENETPYAYIRVAPQTGKGRELVAEIHVPPNTIDKAIKFNIN